MQDESKTEKAPDNCLGYLEYKGRKVEGGLMDARKAARALDGFDELLRFHLSQEAEAFANIDFEIPVEIRRGSWLALIPTTVSGWMLAAAGAGVSAYAIAAGTKMAEHDFKDKGLKEVFKSAFEGIQWTIKIAKHLGSTVAKKFQTGRFLENNTWVELIDSSGNILIVPTKYLDRFSKMSPKIFQNIAYPIDSETELRVGLVKDESALYEPITVKEKQIFLPNEGDSGEDVVLPGLIDGMYVELVGETTRGNESTNSIGFKYQGYTLNCFPESGNVRKFKPAIFEASLIKAVVSRKDKFGRVIENKPNLIFSSLEPLSTTDGQSDLFYNKDVPPKI